MQVEAEGKLYVHPEEGSRRGIGEGDRVKVRTSLGEVETRVGFRERVPRGVAVFPVEYDLYEYGRPYSTGEKSHRPSWGKSAGLGNHFGFIRGHGRSHGISGCEGNWKRDSKSFSRDTDLGAGAFAGTARF